MQHICLGLSFAASISVSRGRRSPERFATDRLGWGLASENLFDPLTCIHDSTIDNNRSNDSKGATTTRAMTTKVDTRVCVCVRVCACVFVLVICCCKPLSSRVWRQCCFVPRRCTRESEQARQASLWKVHGNLNGQESRPHQTKSSHKSSNVLNEGRTDGGRNQRGKRVECFSKRKIETECRSPDDAPQKSKLGLRSDLWHPKQTSPWLKLIKTLRSSKPSLLLISDDWQHWQGRSIGSSHWRRISCCIIWCCEPDETCASRLHRSEPVSGRVRIHKLSSRGSLQSP